MPIVTLTPAQVLSDVVEQLNTLSTEMAKKRRFTVDFEEQLDALILQLSLVEQSLSQTPTVSVKWDYASQTYIRPKTHYFEDCPEYKREDCIQTTLGASDPPNLCAACKDRMHNHL